MAGVRGFSALHSVQIGSGAHAASCLMGTRGFLSWGVKQLVCKADTSPPPSSKVKNVVELYLHSSTHLHDVVLN
jgi:hypothetical protein